MIDLKLYFATVIDNDDTNKLSKIKVRILPEFKDMEEDHLPWVRPFCISGMSATTFSHNPPEIDSKVFVLADKYFKNIYYLNGAFIDGFFDYTKWTNIESSISDIASSTYPDLKFWLLDDGSILFYNSNTGQKGVYHNNGTYIIINQNGGIYTYSKDQPTKFYNDKGNIEIESGGNVVINDGGKFAARKEDETLSDISTDTNYWTWATKYNAFNIAWSAAATALGLAGAAGISAYASAIVSALTALGTIPTSLTGKINEGSGTVEIGD